MCHAVPETTLEGTDGDNQERTLENERMSLGLVPSPLARWLVVENPLHPHVMKVDELGAGNVRVGAFREPETNSRLTDRVAECDETPENLDDLWADYSKPGGVLLDGPWHDSAKRVGFLKLVLVDLQQTVPARVLPRAGFGRCDDGPRGGGAGYGTSAAPSGAVAENVVSASVSEVVPRVVECFMNI